MTISVLTIVYVERGNIPVFFSARSIGESGDDKTKAVKKMVGINNEKPP